MADVVTEEEIWGVGLMAAVSRALRGTGFEPDPDPARGGCKVHVVDDGAVLLVVVPIIDDEHPGAILEVTLDRATLGEVVSAVAERSDMS